MTECACEQLEFHRLGRRLVVAGFDGGTISNNGGVLLLCEVEAKTGLLAAPGWRRAEHSVSELVSQRIIALALGYEDLNDHDRLHPGS
jgi:hypothetical protein